MGLNASKILEIVDNPSILDRIKVDNFTLIQAKINNMLISSLETNGLSEDDLLIFLDFSYNQLLNISEGTSKSQLFKARQMLQTKIKELNNSSYGTN